MTSKWNVLCPECGVRLQQELYQKQPWYCPWCKTTLSRRDAEIEMQMYEDDVEDDLQEGE